MAHRDLGRGGSADQHPLLFAALPQLVRTFVQAHQNPADPFDLCPDDADFVLRVVVFAEQRMSGRLGPFRCAVGSVRQTAASA